MKCPTHLVKAALTDISGVTVGAWLTFGQRLSTT